MKKVAQRLPVQGKTATLSRRNPGAAAAGAREQQAQRLARRFARGEKNLGRGLLPAIPAGFTLAASRRETLPEAIRAELEAAFNADLGAVRLHRDAAAGAAAREQGAHAFASGVDLYFGDGLFDPASTAGLELLAHEVVHVLQQTGRAAHGGRLRANTVDGVGNVQCADIPDFAILRPAHAPPKGNNDRTQFDQIANSIETLTKAKDPADAIATYAAGVVPQLKTLKWPFQAEGLLYDTLKHYEKFDLAAMMIERDNFIGGNRVNTIGFSKGLTDALERRNQGWEVYAKAIASVRWLKGYETEWLSLFEEFLFGPLSDAASVQLARTAAKGGPGSAGASINTHVRDLYGELFEYQTVSNNEWVYNGLLLMHDLDQARRDRFDAIRKSARATWRSLGQRGVLEKRHRAEAVIELGKSFTDITQDFPNIKKRDDAAEIQGALASYLRTLGKRIADIGEKALAVWDQAKSIEDLVHIRADGDQPPPEEIRKQLDQRRDLASRLAVQAGVPPLLAGFLDEINKSGPNGERGLDSVTYRDRAGPWDEKLGQFILGKVELPQIEAFRAGKTEELLAWIALQWWLYAFQMYVRWTLQENITLPGIGPRPNLSTPDETSFHRYKLAEWVHWIAKPLGWTQATQAAEAILQARLEPGHLLAIRSFDDGEVFKRDPLDLGDMVTRAREDFKSNPIRGYEPLTLDTLAVFYQATYYMDFAAELRRLTPSSPAEERKIVQRNAAIPYLASAAKKAIPTQLPQRWYTRDSAFARKASDKRDFADVIFAHPAYKQLDKDKRPSAFTAIAPVEPSQVVAWFIPSFSPLIEILKANLFFQGLVAATFTDEKDPAKQFQKQERLGSADWFQRLQQTLAEKLKDPKFRQEEWPQISGHLWNLATSVYSAATTDFWRAFKEAMRLDRQLVANRVRVALQSFADDHHDLGAINTAIRLLRQFNGVNSGLPDRDRWLQIAALLLEVAPELKQALKYERRLSIVSPALGFMEVGLDASQTIGSLDAQERALLLPPHENTDGWIAGRTAPLREATERLRAVRDSVQKAQGFSADKDKQTITGFVKYSSPLPLFTPLRPRYGGFLGNPAAYAYRVVAVERSFFFHPAYGSRSGQGGPSGYAPIQLLESDGKTPLDVSDTDVLLRIQIIEPKRSASGGQTTWVVKGQVDVTRLRVDLLDDLYNGISWAAFGSAMGNIQAGIEQFLEFYLDVAELLPGVGPAIAAARITAAIGEFMASGDYQALLDTLSGSLTNIVEGLLNSVTQGVDSDNLMLLALFGDRRLDYLLSHSTLGAASANQVPPSTGGGGKFNTLKKSIDAFRRLGKALFKALRKLERYVQEPMQDLRVFASSRPLVSFSLTYAADHIFQIVAMAEKIQRVIAALENSGSDKKTVEQIKADLQQEQKGFGEHLRGTLRAIEQFQLPHTIIDLTPAIATVLTVAEAYVIKRTGFYGKVVNLALKHSGAYDLINSHFAQAIVDAGADPNIYWREKIVPNIETQFNAARDDLVNRVNEVLQSKALSDVFDPVAPLPPMKVATDTGQRFEETEETYLPPAEEADTSPLSADDRALIPLPSGVPAFGAGQPLAAGLRARFEGQLGQDLGHVRLHLGGAGTAMTDAFGADALTSGSHVFVRPGREPRALGHELVHVLQQTGPRPRGTGQPSTPVRGRPERGLDFDPAREAEADAVAAAMTRGGMGPVTSVPAAQGLQPAGVSWFTIARLMREVSNLEAVTASAKEIDKLPGGGTLPRDVRTAVDKILAILNAPSKNPAVFRRPGPFETAMTMVEARLNNAAYKNPIAKAATEIAFQALEPSDAKPSDPRYLSASHFGRQLEAYVLARTGLAFAIEFSSKRVSVPGKDVDAIDLGNPVKTLALVHIHLPYMDGRAPFWATAIDNTWSGSTADYRTRMRKVLRPLLESKGIQPGIWPLMGKDFRFSLWLKGEAERDLKRHEAAKPDPVPPWRDYVRTDKETPGDVGIRLADYDHASQRGKGRESHHLTQYLLADFFSNTNGSKPFAATRDYPGVTRVNNVVKTIANKDKNARDDGAIDVESTKGQGRGAHMPTISLAATTHRKGKLHVTPEPDEQAGGVKKAQGNALQNEFVRHLPPALASASDSEFAKHIAKDRDTAADEIYRATQMTYAMVEKHMSTQLERNMPKSEYQYYLGLVEDTSLDIRDKTNPDVTTKEQTQFLQALEAIPATARQHNHDEMIKFGWKTKV